MRGTWPVCCYTVADVNDKSGSLSESALAEAAARVLENLAELEPELINAAILDREGETVAATSDSREWAEQAAGLARDLEAASGPEKFDSAHIASAEGEVFVVSESGLSLVAVTGRFVLAALTSYDMRMALRDAARAGDTGEPGTISPEAENGGSSDA